MRSSDLKESASGRAMALLAVELTVVTDFVFGLYNAVAASFDEFAIRRTESVSAGIKLASVALLTFVGLNDAVAA